MSDTEQVSNQFAMVSPEIISILGKPPVGTDDEVKIYNATLAAFAKDINPKDLITWFLIKDLADHRMSISIYRKMKAASLRVIHTDFARREIEAINTNSATEKAQLQKNSEAEVVQLTAAPRKTEEVSQEKAKIQKKLQANLKKADEQRERDVNFWQNLPVDDAVLARHWQMIEIQHAKLDSLLEVAQKRFSEALREIERHLGGFGQSLRRNVRNIIDDNRIEIAAGDVALAPE